jgi:hypothetical protein
MNTLISWWEAMPIRQEIRDADGSIDDVTMSLYKAVYSRSVPYADPSYYGRITYPSANLVELMAKVAVRLAGPRDTYLRVPALRRLDQAMGGGKSHGLIGLYHMAANPEMIASTDIGRLVMNTAHDIAGAGLPVDLNRPKVVVLCCDDMVPGVAKKFEDGPSETLWERVLWRLFEGDMRRLAEFGPHYADKSMIAKALEAVGKPVLLLVDEILDYVRQLSRGDIEGLRAKDMGFLKALFDTVNDVRNCAMVVVMIDSETDPMSLSGSAQADRAELESVLQRNGTPATVTSNTDFVSILRRRLFENEPSGKAVSTTVQKFESAMTGSWRSSVFSHLTRTGTTGFDDEVKRCFPFHPDLIRLVEHEWGTLAGYQKVRSTIRIFAATANALQRRAANNEWTPLLIGAGDLVMSDSAVREAVIGSGLIADPKNQANYRGIAENEVVDSSDTKGSARQIDISRAAEGIAPFILENPRASERAATALFLYSVVGTRPGGRLGATENELKAATFVPYASYGHADAEAVLEELCDKDRGLAAIEERPGVGGQPRRFFLSSRQTIPMWFRSMRATVSEGDRDDAIRLAVDNLLRKRNESGPFAVVRFHKAAASLNAVQALEAPFTSSDKDVHLDLPKTRLVALDPACFSLGNGGEDVTLRAIHHVMGVGDKSLRVQWSASLVFAVSNTQARKVARATAADLVAWQRVLLIDQVEADEDLMAKVKGEVRRHEADLDRKLLQAYQHVVFLTPGDEDGSRLVKVLRLDQATESAIDGATVWAKLREEDRSVGKGEFSARAFLANLDRRDLGVPLDEVKNRFWQTVRKPLLWGGENDLKAAIFESVRASKIRIVGAKDELDREVSAVGDIQFIPSLMLAAPISVEKPPPRLRGEYGKPVPGGVSKPSASEPDAQVSLAITASLTDSSKREAVWKAMRALAEAIDDGNVNHIQISVKATGPKMWASDLRDKGAAAGMAVDIRDL